MLSKNLIATLEVLNNPNATVYLHSTDERVATCVCVENGAVLLKDGDESGIKVSWILNTLEKLNPYLRVYLDDMHREEVLFVHSYIYPEKHRNAICLKSESDNDIREELDDRFENAFEDFADEVEFYLDLWETGIDADMLRKYRGDDCANHMIEICEEYGFPAFIGR